MTMPGNPLEKLFDSAAPPPSLRDRVLRDAMPPLKKRPRWQVALALAAALLLAFMGGRATRGESGEAEGAQYLLLLYEGAGYRDDRPMQETVAEYARWADSLRGRRLLTRAHKLDDGQLALLRAQPAVAEAPTESEPTGLFIVRAESPEDAAAIARTSPHLKYGGRIVLRKLL
jgi:hypothetical protein